MVKIFFWGWVGGWGVNGGPVCRIWVPRTSRRRNNIVSLGKSGSAAKPSKLRMPKFGAKLDSATLSQLAFLPGKRSAFPSGRQDNKAYMRCKPDKTGGTATAATSPSEWKRAPGALSPFPTRRLHRCRANQVNCLTFCTCTRVICASRGSQH